MRAVADAGVDLTVVETTSRDDHGWVRRGEVQGWRVITLSEEAKVPRVHRETRGAYGDLLDDLAPDVIVESGYANPYAINTALAYRDRHADARAVFWSETTRFDNSRHWWREAVKARVIGRFDSALVAGTPHARYLQQLGYPQERIGIAGGCVDNAFFATRTSDFRRVAGLRAHLGLPQRYVLYVGRFLDVKNLPFLLEAYRRYRQTPGVSPMGLVLLGGGPVEQRLRAQVVAKSIPDVVFAGTRQVEELPAYYALADALVLPSWSEPWGLVVNEAMASGLPVLVSDRCGCGEDLVEPGVNGFFFSSKDSQELTDLLCRMARGEVDLERMGEASLQRVAQFSLQRFGRTSATKCAETRRLPPLGRRRASIPGKLDVFLDAVAQTLLRVGYLE